MRRRRSTFILGCVVLVLCTPGPGAGQGKSSTKTVPVTVSFSPGGGIQGGPVDGAIYLYPGYLSVRATGITFNFVDPQEVPVGNNCLVSSAQDKGFTYTLPMPAGLPESAAVLIHTYSEFRFVDDGDGTDEWGDWQVVPDAGGDPGFLNLLGLKKGQSTYAQIVFRLTLPAPNDLYDVNFNRAFNAPVSWNGGIFVVQADDAMGNDGVVDTWKFRPLNAADPHLPPYLGFSEANLRVSDVADWKWDPPGKCTLGNFYLPFEMTVTRK